MKTKSVKFLHDVAIDGRVITDEHLSEVTQGRVRVRSERGTFDVVGVPYVVELDEQPKQ